MPSLPDFQTNPFYVLSALPADSSTTLSLRAVNPAGNYTIEQRNAALKELLNPQGRLKAEIAWLPDIGREQTRDILQIASLTPSQLISGADADIYSNISLSPIAKCNITAWKLEILANHGENDFTADLAASLKDLAKHGNGIVSMLETLIEECDFFNGLQQERILELINLDRSRAYYPPLSSAVILEKPIAERVQYYHQTLLRFFDQLYPQGIVEILSRIAMRITRNGRRKPPLLLQLLTNSYERHLQAFLLAENTNINRILSRMQIGKGDKNLQEQWAMLRQVLENWLHVIEPVYLCAKSRDLSYRPLVMQYNRLRNAAWSLEGENNPVREDILKFLDSHSQFPQGR